MNGLVIEYRLTYKKKSKSQMKLLCEGIEGSLEVGGKTRGCGCDVKGM